MQAPKLSHPLFQVSLASTRSCGLNFLDCGKGMKSKQKLFVFVMVDAEVDLVRRGDFLPLPKP